MNCCIEEFNDVLKEILGKEIVLKKGAPEKNSVIYNEKTTIVPVKINDKIEYHFETTEKDEKEIARMEKIVEKVISFEKMKMNEQLLKQAKENFINDVVHFRFENIDSMLSRSEILGFDFYIKRRSIIIEILDMYLLFKDKNELILQQIKEELYDVVFSVFNNKDDIVSYAGSNRFVICKVDDKEIYENVIKLNEELKKKLDIKVKIAIGDSYDLPGIEGMGYSYRDSEKYLQAGKRFLMEEDIYRFNNVGIYLLISNMPKFEKEKMQKYTKNLLEYDEKAKQGYKQFLERLFINNLVLTKTEDELDIAKNKGKNMIHTVKEITGLDPLKFEDAVKLYISLKLLR